MVPSISSMVTAAGRKSAMRARSGWVADGQQPGMHAAGSSACTIARLS